MVLSSAILDEYSRVLGKNRVRRLLIRQGTSEHEGRELTRSMASVAEMVEPSGEPPDCRDERDRIYLHCARDGAVDFLITGDRDLLDIGSVGSAAIITPAEFVRLAVEREWLSES